MPMVTRPRPVWQLRPRHAHFRRDLQHILTLDFRVHQDVFDERRNFAFFSVERGDGQLAFGARQRYVEQAALFLNVKIAGGPSFISATGNSNSGMRSRGGKAP